MGESNEHKGHRKRMREDFFKAGFENWQKHKVLEYLLYYVIPVADTNDTAHRLLKRFGSFANVFRASKKELTEVEGVGEKTAEYICMLGEFVRYHNSVKYDSDFFTLDSESCKKQLCEMFDGKNHECLFMICLDPQFRVIRSECVFEGSFEAMDVDISKIIRVAVKSDASHIVFAHNHPSGVAKASDADIVSTKAIERALYLSGVRLFDHIIVADEKCVSMRGEGLLDTR